MSFIELGDIVLVSFVSLGSAYQLVQFARRVGQARGKFKICPPATTGDPEFDRTFRAQQNTLEFYPIFMTTLWLSAVFVHQVPASFLALYYLWGRYQYMDGYVKSEERRLPGFYKCVKALKYMMYMSVAGLINTALITYLGLDVLGLARSLVWSAVRLVY